jgi:hypothetical protein
MRKLKRNNFWLCVIGLFFLFFLSIDNVIAAKYITVATIGNTPSLDRTQEPQKLVDQVIAFWQRELAHVLHDKPDLIVLPEICDLSGAGEEYLRVRKNQVLDYFASVAKENNCYLGFGTIRDDATGLRRNSFIILDRQGRIAGIYDKNFPTIGEMEKGIVASNEVPVFELDFGRVAVAICFDLNFDELRERYVKEKPDLILFSSMYHGGFVQSLWAYTCRSFFVGSIYRGTPSEIRNPLGDVVATSTNYTNYAVARINLDSELVHIDFNSSRYRALKEKYGPGVTISDPGKLGCVLLTSEHENVSVRQMIKEFNIELLDDYFSRVRNVRFQEGNMK